MAALLVTIGHAEHEVISRRLGGITHPGTQGWIPWGAGVDIFFILSGFMMIYASRGMSGGLADAKRFFRRRYLRITPTYWMFTFLMLAAMFFAKNEINHSEIAIYHVLASLFYIPISGPTGAINPILGVGWTINYEMFFYLVFSATLVLPARAGRFVLPAVLLALVAVGQFVRNRPIGAAYRC